MKPRYSFLIRPINLLKDLFIFNSILYYIGDRAYVNIKFMLYINIVWLLISYYTGYYKIFRTTGVLKMLNLIFGQFFIFILSFFAFFSLFNEGVIINRQFTILLLILVSLFVSKFTFFYALKIYRGLGKNYRRVIVIGCDKSSNKLKKFIVTNPYLGFKNLGYFTDEKSNSKDYLGRIDEAQEFILENKVDEIYCSLSLVKKEKIKELIWFAKANQRKIKLIPDAREIFSKNLSLQYYGTLPIFRIKNFPFEYAEIRFVKRVFDILFSFFICLTILSWLVPLLFILIKLESKGPLFFKQKRHGLSGKEFSCYKFRSMNTNSEAHKKSATKDDDRITRIGNFIRKTSIDELPQFLNVLKGDMSVVGPRPHMIKQSEDFENKIDNYIKRNAVKPGITGLAQVSGYRGEIQKKSDIENRVRLDIFYIENWSFLLDIKIIYKTLISVFKGEEKAY